MPFRDGSLSTFKGANPVADHFVIKFPFNNPASGHIGDGTDKQLAAHWNHYFDACICIEQYLFNIINTNLQARYSYEYGRSLIPTSAVKFGYHTTTVPFTGTVLTTNITVPSAFGTDPFGDGRFAIAHTVYLQNAAASGLEGTYLSSPTDPSLFNNLLDYPQLYTMIYPTGGSNFTVLVCALSLTSHTLSFGGTFSDDFERTVSGAGATLGANWQDDELGGATSRPRAFRILNGTYNSVSRNALRIRSRNNYTSSGDTPDYQAGTAYPKGFKTLKDQSIEFEYLDLGSQTVANGEYYSRCGAAVRLTGTGNNTSFYAFDVVGTKKSAGVLPAGRLLLVKVGNLYNSSALTSDWQNINSNVITLATINNVYSLVSAVASGLATTSVRYQLKAVGNQITVSRSLDSGAWTQLASVTDNTLDAGAPGLFSHAMGISSPTTVSREIVIDNVVASSLDSGYTARINLLYSLIGESGVIGNINL